MDTCCSTLPIKSVALNWQSFELAKQKHLWIMFFNLSPCGGINEKAKSKNVDIYNNKIIYANWSENTNRIFTESKMNHYVITICDKTIIKLDDNAMPKKNLDGNGKK